MRSLPVLFVCAVMMLVGCGGGGGSGGGQTPSITLQAGEAPVQRHAMQILEARNLELDQETYTAYIDGQETLLGTGLDGQLILLLPANLSAGTHKLLVRLDDRDFTIPFTVAPSVVAPMQDSLDAIELIFSDARLAIDTQIQILTDLGADQSVIDDLLSKRDQLDTSSEDFQALTAEELDYLSKLLADLLDDEAAARRALINLPDGCNAPAFVRKLVRFAAQAAVTGIVAANVSVFGTPILGAVVGGVLLADTLTKVRPLANEFAALWPNCIEPITSKIVAEPGVRSTIRSAARRSTILNVEEGVIDFVVEIPEIYVMQTEFDVFQGLLDYFPGIRDFVTTYAFAIPDDIESFILDRTADDYAEAIDPASIALLGITAANVSGDIDPIDETRFSITFSVSGPFEDEPVFDFVLHDTINDIQTRYTANLIVPEHCPVVLPGTGHLAIGPDRCFYIQEKEEFQGEGIYYHEFRYGLPLVYEDYSLSGATSLKADKGLQDYDQLPDFSVGKPDTSLQYVVFADGDAYQSVLSRQEQNFASLSTVMDYSEPFEASPGFWNSVIAEQNSYEGGELISTMIYSEPLEGEGGVWTSALVSDVGYFPGGAVSGSTTYSQPQQTASGVWVSVPQESLIYWSAGILRERQTFSPPVQNPDGAIEAIEKSRQYYVEDGWLKTDITFSAPLQKSDGFWESIVIYSATYVIDGYLDRETEYGAPLLSASDEWVAPLVRELIHGGFLGDIGVGYIAYITDYGPYKVAGDGQMVAPRIRDETQLDGATVGYINYGEPAQGSDGNWYSNPVGTTVSYDFVSGDISEMDYSVVALVHPDTGAISNAPTEHRIYTNDVLVSKAVYHDPVFDELNGVWQWPESQRTYYNLSGIITSEQTYSAVLFADAGYPQVVLDTSKSWVNGVLDVTESYFNPYKEGGTWFSRVERITYHQQGCYTEFDEEGQQVLSTCG